MIHVLRRFFKRNNIIIFVIVFVLATIFFIAQADAETGTGFKVEGYQKYEQYIIARPATTTTTTTTTTTRPKPPAVRQVSAMPTGDWVAQCHLWAEQAGIVLPDAAIKLIGRESSCNPSVMNRGGSGAGGIPQALPYTKMGCPMDTSGAVCQLKWMHGYVMGRYGSWENALAHSYSHNWY